MIRTVKIGGRDGVILRLEKHPELAERLGRYVKAQNARLPRGQLSPSVVAVSAMLLVHGDLPVSEQGLRDRLDLALKAQGF